MRIMIIAFLLAIAGGMCSQSIERQVFSSFGKTTFGGGYSLSTTGGETTAAFLTTPNGESLSLGFQQEFEIILQCLGDFNNDGFIDTSDLLALLSQFLCVQQCFADMNLDNQVNTQDLLLFLSLFGTQCQ